MSLPRIVQSLAEIDELLPHPPGTYDHTTISGMEKDDANTAFCVAAMDAIVDDMHGKHLVTIPRQRAAAAFYFEAWRFYTDRFDESLARVKDLEYSKKARPRRRPKGQGALDREAAMPATIECDVATDNTQGSRDTDASAGTSSISLSEKLRSFSLWEKIDFLKSLNVTPRPTTPLLAMEFERKNRFTGETLITIDKRKLMGLNLFSLDGEQVWPKSRPRDSSGGPIFEEPELQPYLQTCPATKTLYLSMYHAKLTYDTRLREDPAQHKQWMEDHGFYNTCNSSRAQRRNKRNRRGLKCDHGWPCCCSKDSEAPEQYTLSENRSHDERCDFGVKCHHISRRTLAFFEFCANTGLHDCLPSKERPYTSRVTRCTSHPAPFRTLRKSASAAQATGTCKHRQGGRIRQPVHETSVSRNPDADALPRSLPQTDGDSESTMAAERNEETGSSPPKLKAKSTTKLGPLPPVYVKKDLGPL